MTAVLLACLKKHSAHVRYIVSCCSLGMMLVIAVITANSHLLESSQSIESVAAGPVEAARLVGPALPTEAHVESVTPLRSGGRLEIWLPFAVLLWLAGVVTLSLRLIAGWIVIDRLRRKSSVAASELCCIVKNLASQLKITRPILVLESAMVQVPTVIGWFRPAVLLPVSILTGLSLTQVEAVLAHELAHI